MSNPYSMNLNHVDLTPEACDRRLFDCLVEITKNPEHWKQGSWGLADWSIKDSTLNEQLKTNRSWPCGTTGCLAGTAIISEGLGYFEGGNLLVKSLDRHFFSIGSVGARLFGIDDRQAKWLFNGRNSLRELWNLAAEFTNGRVTMPEELGDQVSAIDDARAA